MRIHSRHNGEKPVKLTVGSADCSRGSEFKRLHSLAPTGCSLYHGRFNPMSLSKHLIFLIFKYHTRNKRRCQVYNTAKTSGVPEVFVIAIDKGIMRFSKTHSKEKEEDNE